MVKYTDIVSIKEIKNTYKLIYKKTTNKRKLINFELAYTSNITKIYNTLHNKNYKHLQYNLFIIDKPKYRIVMSEKMADKIVNRLVCNHLLKPVILPKLIEQNVATRDEKGTSAGIDYIKRYINSIKENHDDIYALKCDITKYFYNIDHQILLSKIKNDITDVDAYNIIKEIINSTNQEYVNDLIAKTIDNKIKYLEQKSNCDIKLKQEQLNALPRYTKGKGLPIGNESSQLLAIYYLNDLDHYIKEQLHIKYYVRYMDDFILIHHDKEYLKKCLVDIKNKLQELNLELNEKTQIVSLKYGFIFLGYKFKLKGKRLIILLRSKNKNKIKKKLRKLKVKNKAAYDKSLASYKGYFATADSNGFIYKNKLE